MKDLEKRVDSCHKRRQFAFENSENDKYCFDFIFWHDVDRDTIEAQKDLIKELQDQNTKLVEALREIKIFARTKLEGGGTAYGRGEDLRVITNKAQAILKHIT